MSRLASSKTARTWARRIAQCERSNAPDLATYPGRRFALPWAISVCPVGAVGVRWLIGRPQGSFATTGRAMIIHRTRFSGLLPQRGAR